LGLIALVSLRLCPQAGLGLEDLFKVRPFNPFQPLVNVRGRGRMKQCVLRGIEAFAEPLIPWASQSCTRRGFSRHPGWPSMLRWLTFGTREIDPTQSNTIMATKTQTTSAKRGSLVTSLNQVLADSYALMSLTHLAHWNVEGAGFFALHTAFQTQYEELFTAIDEIAERIRALGDYAIGGLGRLSQIARMTEFASPLSQERYVQALIKANEKLVADAKNARDLAGEADDPESEDLMIQRITLHEKTIWMLRSFLKS